MFYCRFPIFFQLNRDPRGNTVVWSARQQTRAHYVVPVSYVVPILVPTMTGKRNQYDLSLCQVLSTAYIEKTDEVLHGISPRWYRAL